MVTFNACLVTLCERVYIQANCIISGIIYT